MYVVLQESLRRLSTWQIPGDEHLRKVLCLAHSSFPEITHPYHVNRNAKEVVFALSVDTHTCWCKQRQERQKQKALLGEHHFSVEGQGRRHGQEMTSWIWLQCFRHKSQPGYFCTEILAVLMERFVVPLGRLRGRDDCKRGVESIKLNFKQMKALKNEDRPSKD